MGKRKSLGVGGGDENVPTTTPTTETETTTPMRQSSRLRNQKLGVINYNLYKKSFHIYQSIY
jgi:hypothetical protein